MVATFQGQTSQSPTSVGDVLPCFDESGPTFRKVTTFVTEMRDVFAPDHSNPAANILDHLPALSTAREPMPAYRDSTRAALVSSSQTSAACQSEKLHL